MQNSKNWWGDIRLHTVDAVAQQTALCLPSPLKPGRGETKVTGVDGSRIESGDEGLMQEEIESCLQPVIAAVAKSPDGRLWALDMLLQDRSGFLCQKELAELAGLGPGSA